MLRSRFNFERIWEVRGCLKDALNGKPEAMKELLDRLEGTVVDRT